ncbi:MAG: diguanylate cyclase [Lawsonibacter sp.]|jgi:diguanylate cyclase (GGDEF)-like protein|nr:diguanylate cyclase [Lawsonibacter sp.]
MSKQKNVARMAVVLTVCGALLLIVAVGSLVLRCRTLEFRLNEMYLESLTAHTGEAGEGAGYLIHYGETALKNIDLLIEEESRAPEKGWVAPVVNTFNLVDNRMELSYLDRRDMEGRIWGSEGPELVRRVLSGEPVVSGLISDQGHESSYVVVAHPVEWDGQVVGALQARMRAETLLHQGKHSTFFHSVHSVIAGEDGRVVYGSSPETAGAGLVDLSADIGITVKEGQALNASYQAAESGSFYYDPAGGRCYVAWGQVGYNGWRIVQFSQSPNVQLERESMVQTVVMLVSLAGCAVLAALVWRQRAKLAAEKLRYDTLSEFKDTLIFEYDCRTDSMEFTSNALETLDLKGTRLERVTDGSGCFPVFHPDDIGNVRRALRGTVNMIPDQIEHDRIRMKKRDGEYSWYRGQYKAVFSPEGKAIRLIGTLTDISAQIDREQELRHQAQQDPLTDVYNRAGVKLINARLEQISRGILFMLDLDDFKFINDTYGHAAGDKVLVAMGQILKDIFRTDDIVARVGGDEFVAFLSGSDNASMAQEKAQELLDRVRELKLEGIDTQISVSIGIASAPTYGRTFESLSASADEAMYEIKNGGKGGFALR